MLYPSLEKPNWIADCTGVYNIVACLCIYIPVSRHHNEAPYTGLHHQHLKCSAWLLSTTKTTVLISSLLQLCPKTCVQALLSKLSVCLFYRWKIGVRCAKTFCHLCSHFLLLSFQSTQLQANMDRLKDEWAEFLKEQQRLKEEVDEEHNKAIGELSTKYCEMQKELTKFPPF